MIMTIVGKVDSRALSYTISRGLHVLGKTVIVTDDGGYKRLYNGNSLSGTVSGVDIFIKDKLDKEFVTEIINSNKYVYMLIVSMNYVYERSDCAIVCKGIDKTLLADDEGNGEDNRQLETIDMKDIKHEEVYVSFETVPKKEKVTYFPLRDGLLRYVYSCEENKEFKALDDKAFNKEIAKLVSSLFGKIDQNEFLTILKKNNYTGERRK